MEKEISLEDLMFILGNPTRRKILQLLTKGSRYPFEIATQLRITPRAVSQHLALLEEKGIVKKKVVESPIGPERTYYYVDTSLFMSFSIAPNTFRELLDVLPGVVEASNGKLKRLLDEIYSLESVGNPLEKLEKGVKLLNSIEKELSTLREEEKQLIQLSQMIFQEMDQVVKEFNLLPNAAASLRIILESGGECPLSKISELLDIREEKLIKALEDSEKRGIIKIETSEKDNKCVLRLRKKD
ncbi:MAG: helix-turn-helix domain-containing protein [Candidatus Jordarchaeaceae archaeon]